MRAGNGALYLLASDVNKAEAMLGAGVERYRNTFMDGQFLVAPPAAQDGLTYIIREYPIEMWRAECMARTGEKLMVQTA